MSNPSTDTIQALNTLVDSAITLVQQLRGALAQIQKNTQRQPEEEAAAPEHNGLHLARDSASLIKAHTTKLSLLVITEPLTPSAITKVLRELVAGPLTGLATAVELCAPGFYTHALQQELLWRSQGVYTGLLDFLQKIPRDGKVLTGGAKEGSAADGKGSLASTGILWSACDKVIELATQGLRGFYVHKIGEWKDTLEDIADELKEWGDEEDNEASDDDTDDAESDAQDIVNDFMDSHGTIPKDDPDGLRPRLESTLRRLRLAVILCMAVDKRRMKKLPTDTPGKDVIARLNIAVDKLRQLPDDFGDLAAALYDLDPEEVDEAIEKCCSNAVAIGETLNLDWNGASDEFTEWMTKFRSEIRKS
ncbi:grap2 and cyclin-D-interacting domain-containing protein [Sarocladium implicatum]|nr:grap2 and cyclin-D-interacting domain-containing protein [Sarocladium implicatum]